MDEQQLNKVANDEGFIAALDQSGGSTPKALKLYGVEESEYSGDDEMFATLRRYAHQDHDQLRASAVTVCSARSSSNRPWTVRSRARARPSTSGT